MDARHQLPPKVLGHPLLQRLAPDLREKVMGQLRSIASQRGGAAFASASPRPLQLQGYQTQVQVLQDMPPPPNHCHAGAQTSFPSDASVQTDDELQAQQYRQGVARSLAASMPLAPPGYYGEDPPPRSPHGGGDDIKNEAHARLLAERLMLHDPAAAPEPPAVQQLASPPSPSLPPAPLLPREAVGNVEQQVREEFWRHFNEAFDRAVVSSRDPEVDSLLRDVAPVVDTAENAALYTEPLQLQVDSERYAVRKEAQDIFWQEYTQSLGSLMPAPAAAAVAARRPSHLHNHNRHHQPSTLSSSSYRPEAPVYQSYDNPHPSPVASTASHLPYGGIVGRRNTGRVSSL